MGEPSVGAQTNKDTSFPGKTYVALLSCDDDALAVGNFTASKPICDAEANLAWGNLRILTLGLVIVRLNLI